MGLLGKIAVSAVIIILAIPGLVIEPGPITEIIAIGLLAAVWLGDKSPSEAAQEATGVE